MSNQIEDIEQIRKRIRKFSDSLKKFFVKKEEIIDLMTICAIAQEPLLIVGPPGTAKSDLVLKFKDALEVSEEEYFEYMLTRFTEPGEIIGVIDIKQMKEGKYIRKKQGKLPTASIAFLDEIFKSNSAILNILLSIINEKKFYQDGKPEDVPLKILFAATNEIPDQGELSALKDRFVLKVRSKSIQDNYFKELIDAGLKSDSNKSLNRKPWKEGLATLQDFIKANQYITSMFASNNNDREKFFPNDVFDEFQRIVVSLAKEDRIIISDRKLVKLYKLMRVKSWINHGGTVERNDLKLLSYVGDSFQQIECLEQKIPSILGK